MNAEQKIDILEKLNSSYSAMSRVIRCVRVEDGNAAYHAHIELGNAITELEEIEPIEICSYTGDVVVISD